MLLRDTLGNKSYISIVLPLVQLLLVHIQILPMHLSHFFDLVQVNNEAPFISVVLLYAFSAENCQVVGAIKVLHPLVVFVAEEALDAALVLVVDVPKDVVSLDYLVQDIEV